MTQKVKNNLDKKNKIKKIVFKVLHVIGYICTLFTILLCIGLGVSSCDNQDRNEHTQSQSIKVDKNTNYMSNNYGTYTIYYDELIDDSFASIIYNYLNPNDVTNSTKQDLPFTFTLNYYNVGNKYTLTFTKYTTTSSYYQNPVNVIKYIRFFTSGDTSFDLKYGFSYGGRYYAYGWYFNTTNTNGSNFLGQCEAVFSNVPTNLANQFNNYIDSTSSSGYTSEDLENAYSEGYDYGYSIGYDGGYDFGYLEGFQEGGNIVEFDGSLTIDYNYDFRKLFTDNLDVNSGLFTLGFTPNGVMTYQYLISNGDSWYIGDKQYNGIVFVCISFDSNSSVYLQLSNGTYVSSSDYLSSGNWFGGVALYYVYFEETPLTVGTWLEGTNGSYIVDSDYYLKVVNYANSGNTGDVNNRGYLSYYLQEWVSGGFRTLTHYDDTNTFVNIPTLGNSLTLYQVLTLNDNGITTDVGSYSNVFSLLSVAFSSFTNLLNIAILPGITLGLLMFIPLVVGIIMIIIKIIKK